MIQPSVLKSGLKKSPVRFVEAGDEWKLQTEYDPHSQALEWC